MRGTLRTTVGAVFSGPVLSIPPKIDPERRPLPEGIATWVSLGRAGFGEWDEDETAVLTFGLGFLTLLVVLLIGALGLSVSMSMTTIVLEFDVLVIAGGASLDEDLTGCWAVTGKGGDKRGRFGSGGDAALLSLSRFGGGGYEYTGGVVVCSIILCIDGDALALGNLYGLWGVGVVIKGELERGATVADLMGS